MTPLVDRLASHSGSQSRRSVLRGLVGAATALAAALPDGIARATDVASYCAESPEQEFLRLINDYRAANGRGRLTLVQHVGAAAQHHSTDMANRNYLSHTTQGSSDGPPERMIAHGYPANTTWWGENIYAGYGVLNGVDLGSAQGAFNWWKNSPGHNANMLNANYTVIGIDRASNPNAQYRNYWTTDFGGAADQAATLCGGTTPPPTPTPTPSPTPSPTPTQLTILGSQQSSNSNGGYRAYDNNAGTSWRTALVGTPPASAWVQFDLGSAKTISEIRWQFSQLGSADQFTIDVSSNATTWQTLATRGNAAAVNAWETLTTNVSARYVRFNFANPNRDSRLGYLSEVQVYGPATTARRGELAETGNGKAKQASVPAISSEDKNSGRSGKKKQRKQRGSNRKRR
ncbi:MAG: CAP domain-containing protein [Thermomicrobiales bacterium]